MTLSIVHALAPARFGGLESVVHTLATGQARAGDRVTVCGVFAREPTDHPFWSAIEALPEVRAVSLVLGTRQYLRERRELRSVLQEASADVLHTHGYRPDVVLAPVGRSMGIATVATVHGFTGITWKGRVYEWLQRRALRRFDGVVAVSRKLGRELDEAGVPKRVLHVVPNAWSTAGTPLSRHDAREALGLPEHAPVAGWVGRLSSEKAPELALGALDALDVDEARLSFIGDGALRGQLEEEVRARHLASRVHFHGVVPGAARYLRAFDALLITSWTEGTPVVLLEAMDAEVPVVTTAVGGIPDVVSEVEAALVAPGDTAAMARALGLIFEDGPAAAARARRAQARLRRDFAVEPWVRRYDDIYRSCTGS